MVGGTFTITNVGVFGVDTGTPIINPGEAAILAARARSRTRRGWWTASWPCARSASCAVASTTGVVDGEQGSQFLADVGALLADPAMAITF